MDNLGKALDMEVQDTALLEVSSGFDEEMVSYKNPAYIGKKFGLNWHQVEFALALASCGWDVANAAEKCGVDLATAKRWNAAPRFQKYVELELLAEFKRRIIRNVPRIIDQINECAFGDPTGIMEAFEHEDATERIAALRRLPKSTLGRIQGWAYDKKGRMVPKLVPIGPMLELAARLNDPTISAQLGNSKSGNVGAPVNIVINSAVPDRVVQKAEAIDIVPENRTDGDRESDNE